MLAKYVVALQMANASNIFIRRARSVTPPFTCLHHFHPTVPDPYEGRHLIQRPKVGVQENLEEPYRCPYPGVVARPTLISPHYLPLTMQQWEYFSDHHCFA
jgi:hypothetical protein